MKGKSIAFTNDLFFETDENSTVDFEVKPLKTKVTKKNQLIILLQIIFLHLIYQIYHK